MILSIDVVGSTKLSQAVSDETYARIIAATVSELSLVVPQFHGHVLNYTGDGFIAYFAEPSFTTKNDLAIDCALTLRLLLYRAINPALEARSLPKLGIRIGSDSGDAVVVTLGDPRTKQHKDIIGAVVNLAAKIQARAEPGTILVGETVDLSCTSRGESSFKRLIQRENGPTRTPLAIHTQYGESGATRMRAHAWCRPKRRSHRTLTYTNTTTCTTVV